MYRNGRNYRDSLVNIFSVERSSQESRGFSHERFNSNDMVILTEFGYDSDYFKNGQYDHETFKVEDFPFVFFTLDQCRAMLTKGGLFVQKEIASDGVSELLAERINQMDKESYQQYLRYHFYCCEKPEMLGRSNHLLFIALFAAADIPPV